MISIIIEAVALGLTLGGSLWGIARWTARVDRNTEATDRLTTSFDTFSEKVQGKLSDHEVRITILEKTQVEK
jgi:hypothetical protein